MCRNCKKRHFCLFACKEMAPLFSLIDQELPARGELGREASPGMLLRKALKAPVCAGK